MAITTTLNTPDFANFLSQQPTLEFTGVDSGGLDIGYEVKVYNSTQVPYDGINHGQNSATLVGPDSVVIVIKDPSTTGRVIASTDGREFTTVVELSYSQGVYAAQAGDKFFYSSSSDGGVNGHVNVSSDGFSWQATYMGGRHTLSAGVAYGNGIYVCQSSTSELILTSTDGITWTVRSTPGLPKYTSLIFAGDRFIMAGSAGRNAVSFDGISWETKTDWSIGTVASESLAYSNGVLYVAGNLGSIYSTTDFGDSFTTITPPTSGYRSDWVIPFGYGVLHSRSKTSSTTNSTVREVLPSGVVVNSHLSIGSKTGNFSSMGHFNGVEIYRDGNTLGYRDMHTFYSAIDSGFTDSVTGSPGTEFISGRKVVFTPDENIPFGQYSWAALGYSDTEVGSFPSARTLTLKRPPNPGIFMQFLT